MEKEYRIRPYYKSEQTEALAQTGYRRNQRLFTSKQVALIFEYFGEP